MAQRAGFLPAITLLWQRLSAVAIISLLFFLASQMPPRLVGWSYYLTTAEVVFEIATYAVVLALVGVIFGAVCAAAVAPFLFYRRLSRLRIVEAVTSVAVGIAAFIDLWLVLGLILQSFGVWGRPKYIIFACYVIAFGVVLWIPRRRKQLVTSLDGYLGERATRRALIGTGIAAAALVVTEAAIGKIASAAVIPRRAVQPSGPNILLVTFDALSAEDMSLYGYRLPTTPHIDEFARKSSVFTNYYSASTFTTPSIATMMTGLEPSEHRVYHLDGSFREPSGRNTLPHLMRAGGYSTGASISNPYAYFLIQGIAEDFDILPSPPYRADGLMRFWDATRILHQRQPVGSRSAEFWDLDDIADYVPDELANHMPRYFAHTKSEFPPAGSFDQARDILKRLPDGFFMWVHLFAPHWPYLPDAKNLGRFLPADQRRSVEDQTWSEPGDVEKERLRYDEFIADADCGFGSFIADLERERRLQNTAVIFSADHGESFEGGVYGHGNSFQTRPEIHIPLMIRMPGQERGSRVAFTADNTALAPTILEIAGVPRADWMRGPSLVPWLNRDSQGQDQGLAFTQYLARDTIFKPVFRGTVGVVDGRHQYILNLLTGKGILRGLDEAQSKDLDRSAENPALAQTLREAIYARFPDLPRKPA